MPKIFFTDLDGTLEDSRQDMAEAVVESRKHFGLRSESFEAYVPHVNRGMKELTIHCFSELFADITDQEQLNKKIMNTQLIYEQFYLEKISVHTKLYPNMNLVLKQLSKIGSIVVITNKPHYLSTALLIELDAMKYVSLIMGGDSCAETKPSPMPLHISAQQLNYNPSTDIAFMIGDSPADVACGKAFGAKTIWCSYGYASDPGQKIPDFVAQNCLQILDFI